MVSLVGVLDFDFSARFSAEDTLVGLVSFSLLVEAGLSLSLETVPVFFTADVDDLRCLVPFFSPASLVACGVLGAFVLLRLSLGAAAALLPS